MRLIATVEDPDTIRAILATLSLSDEGADRAPPFVPSPRSVRSGLERFCLPVKGLLAPPEIL